MFGTKLLPNNAELKNEQGAIPQCFEESPFELGIIKCYGK